MTIAALYVESDGCYFGIDGVDPWDIERDARNYKGPHPVLAHPPCTRWCMMAGLVEHRYGYMVGDDDGLFCHALWAVRRFGGVLEHPANSKAWKFFGMGRPRPGGGWVECDSYGMCCHVEQGHYGHRSRKGTWLYAVGCDLPDLAKGKSEARAWVGYGDYDKYPDVPRLGAKESKKTPDRFREILIAMARSVEPGKRKL